MRIDRRVDATSTAAGASASADAIKVGVLFSLSGNLSIAETSMKNATILAIDEINARGGVGGRKLEPVIEDYASDFGVVVQKARKLVEQDRVAATIGCYASASRKAVLPVFEQGSGVLLYPTFYEGLECSTNVIYTSLVAAQHLTDTADWMVRNAGKRIYMVGSDYVGPQTYNAIVKKLVEEQGATVVENRFFPLDQTEFGSALSRDQSRQTGSDLEHDRRRRHPRLPQAVPGGRLHARADADLLRHLHRAGAGGGRRRGGEGPLLPVLVLRDDRHARQQIVHPALPGEVRQGPADEHADAGLVHVGVPARGRDREGRRRDAEAILEAFPGVSAEAPGEGTVTVQDNHHTTHTVSLGQANDKSALRRDREIRAARARPVPDERRGASKIPSCPRRES